MDLINPNPAEINLADIARGLSRECRFNGHCRRFYSVAEHSVNCVALFDLYACGDIYNDPALRDIARDILMHDAHEAYVKDITTPLKKAIGGAYNPIADRIQAAISARFNLVEADPGWVKRCDIEMLAAEKQALLPGCGDWVVLDDVTIPKIEIWGMDPEIAERDFIMMAEQLDLPGAAT